jgi:hypothetical protein
MTEILTESFCERCGTRYTFETAAPKRSRLGRVRVATKGLRNYVMQDESSFSEAMADARSDEERSATTHQLDAFHKTFNFCMTCRQYTCGNCWNTAEGRCLTCSPLPEVEPPSAVLAEAVVAEAPEETEPPVAAEDEAWPEADLAPDRLARAMGIAGAATAAGGAAGEPSATEEMAVADVSQVRGLAPGESLEDALAAYEAQIAAQEAAALESSAPSASPEVEPEVAPVAEIEPEVEPEAAPVAAEVEPVAVAEVEPEAAPVAATGEPVAEIEPEVEPEAAPVAATVEPVAEVEPEVAPVAAAPRDDVVPQPTWPIPTRAPETPAAAQPAPEPTAPLNPWLTVAPDDGSAAPQWPAAPQWTRPTTTRELPTTLAGRPIVPQDNAAALWAASAREVLAGGPNSVTPTAAVPATPQPCVSCGLSLSPNARFCRRCGTRQA